MGDCRVYKLVGCGTPSAPAGSGLAGAITIQDAYDAQVAAGVPPPLLQLVAGEPVTIRDALTYWRCSSLAG